MYLYPLSAAILLLAFTMASGRSIPQDENRQELDKLQGEWVMRTSELNGKETTPANPPTMSIQRSEYSFLLPGRNPQRTEFRIDATKQPKHFDRVLPNGHTSPGIYKLDGEILTICRWNADTRPTEFKTTDKGGAITVWKRKK